MIICLLFPFMGFSQTKVTDGDYYREDFAVQKAKEMLTSSRQYRFWGIDSTTQKTIVENKWKLMYEYDKTFLKMPLKAESNRLIFVDGNFFLIYPKNPEREKPNLTGKYFIDGDYLLLLRDTDDITNSENIIYEIINLIDDEFLVVEVHYYSWKTATVTDSRNPLLFSKEKTVIKLEKTHRRLLYQRLNMGILNEEKAKQLFEEKPQIEDTNLTSSSIEGAWKMIYRYDMYGKKPIFNLQKTYGSILDFKDGKFHHDYPYDSELNYSGQYAIGKGQYSIVGVPYSTNGIHLSLIVEGRENYYYNIINIFDNKYMVMEKVCIKCVKQRKDTIKKKSQLYLFRRIE